MTNKGWVNVSLKDGLIARIDAFLASNTWGYSNRAEVVTAALREFLERHASTSEASKSGASKTESTKRQ